MNILILGMGITGKAAYNLFKNKDVNIYIYDEKSNYPSEGEFKIFQLEDLDKINLAIKSPGIKPCNNIVNLLKNNNIETISDLEYFYRENTCDNIVAITGTNGKTTTTSLLGRILSATGNNTFIGGNIGIGVLELLDKAQKNDYVVIEASSFQLEDTIRFKPKISIVTNLTADHLDWHGSEENYRNAKFNIFKNQNKEDFTILNYDDRNLNKLMLSGKNIYYFSTNKEVRGCYVKDKVVYFKGDDSQKELFSIDNIKIPGKHNIENILCAVLAAILLNINEEIIKKVVFNFTGVEHRNEFVREVNGIKYYNDSKGTNPDSTMKAIEALEKNIILIAGGYDKNTDFTELLTFSKNKVKSLILLGETKGKINDKAIDLKYDNIFLVDSLKEAVIKSVEIAKPGDVVLLSPACASWDMYKSYEERGNEFKGIVNEIR